MKNSDVLLRLLALLGPKDSWTQDYFAKDSEGVCVEIDNPSATCFCLIGGLNRIRHEEDRGRIYKTTTRSSRSSEYIREAISKKRRGNCISTFNDSPKTKHGDVVEVITTAVFLALADEAA